MKIQTKGPFILTFNYHSNSLATLDEILKKKQTKKRSECPCVHLQVPDAGGVEEGRMHLDDGVHLPHIPHIHTVVIIHTAEPAADRVVGNGDGVRVANVLVGRKQVADGRKKINKWKCIVLKNRGIEVEPCLRSQRPEFVIILVQNEKFNVEMKLALILNRFALSSIQQNISLNVICYKYEGCHTWLRFVCRRWALALIWRLCCNVYTQKKGFWLETIEETRWEEMESTMLEQVKAPVCGPKGKWKKCCFFHWCYADKGFKIGQRS